MELVEAMVETYKGFSERIINFCFIRMLRIKCMRKPHKNRIARWQKGIFKNE